MEDQSDNHKYMSEAIWLPTYAVIVLASLSIEDANISMLVMLTALIATRAALEITYRVVFGVKRLSLRLGIAAFFSQLVIIGGAAAWLHYSR